MQDAKLKRKLLVMPITVCQDYLARARLDGRGFVILGAGGGGLGDATCIALAGAGAELICVDWLPDQADAIATRVGGTKYVADVTKRDERILCSVKLLADLVTASAASWTSSGLQGTAGL